MLDARCGLWGKIKNMNDFLAPIIMAARRRGPQGWGNILFIVFLAIVWAIGGILKVRKNAQEKKAGGQPLGAKPGGKPAGVTKAKPKGPFQQIRAAFETELQKQRELQLKAQQARRKMVRLQPAAQKVSAKTEVTTEIPTFESRSLEKLTQPAGQVEPELKKLPEFEGKIYKKLEEVRTGAPVKMPHANYLSEILLDYSSPVDLRRAILHYEILGRPLSLRDPSEHTIGL
jgi:hypothetical protein